MTTDTIHYRAFLTLLVAISLAFVWLLTPFIGAVFWAIVIAILFTPLQRRLLALLPRAPNLASFITLLVIVLMVLLPVGFLVRSVVVEVIQLYRLVQAGEFGIGNQFEQVYQAVPKSAQPWLEWVGLGDIDAIKSYVSRFATQAVRVMGNQAVNIGQNTFLFVLSLAIMLYLLYFLLRDGSRLSAMVNKALPLADHQKSQFLDKLAIVVRATIKGNVAVAAIQGALGGLIFWILDIPSAILWGTLMAILSLLPAVGASLVWAPVAIYFFSTGAISDAIILTLFGVLVIGLVDNMLRPILVGKDTRLPDYLVLISTLGGLTLFGLSGFVAGPLIAALFMVAWDLFTTMRGEAAGAEDETKGDGA